MISIFNEISDVTSGDQRKVTSVILKGLEAGDGTSKRQEIMKLM
jgi:hypothetical protein